MMNNLNIVDRLNKHNIVLASTSPRRRELLEKLGLKFTVEGSNFVENLAHENFSTPKDYVLENAICKGKEVAERVKADFIISADTIVVNGSEILEKPKADGKKFKTVQEAALDTLSRLNGKKHAILTAVAVFKDQVLLETFVEETQMEFFQHSLDFLQSYIDTGEPFDKAGSYGIQGHGALLVKRIEGCFYNAVGLPIAQLFRVLLRLVDGENSQI